MYHTKFHGTHYDIGHRYGSALRSHGKFILDNVPFPVGEKQSAFAAACLPYYEQYFPEILLEIEGLAEGQQCPVQKLEAVLFSMYCMEPSCHCSHFAVRSREHVIFGRNSDFLTCIEKLYANSIYRFTNGACSFMGNTTAFIQMEDGVNEHGLAIGLTMVPSTVIRPGLNAGMILRLLLERCADVQEALKLLRTLPIASGQTFILADSKRDIALVECNGASMEIVLPQEPEAFVCATNSFHTASMKKYNLEAVDNWQAEERYQTLLGALEDDYRTFDMPQGQALLSGQRGFLCQYDRRTGKDTVWSVLYDAIDRKMYRAEGNPARKRFREDTRFCSG